jgi:hypothetical protein
MEGARAHSFSIIAAALLFLIAGFTAGFAGAKLFAHSLAKKDKLRLAGSSTIMQKRMAAINEARKNGRGIYEFEIQGLYPTLGKN